MQIEKGLVLAALLCSCSPATAPSNPDPAPDPTDHPVGHEDHQSAPASAIGSTEPAPAASVTATVSAAAASDKCEQLTALCHDVGHSGGEPARCHELGHAREDAACEKSFAACKSACEAAAKATPKQKHTH